MSIVTGVVESVQNPNQWGKLSIRINGNYYSTNPDWVKPDQIPSVGDTVSFEDGGKTYYKNAKVTKANATIGGGSSSSPTMHSGSRTFPVGVTAPERTINRQNALTNAIKAVELLGKPDEVYASVDALVADVLDIAKRFEAYTTGDMDMEEAKKAIAEMGI